MTSESLTGSLDLGLSGITVPLVEFILFSTVAYIAASLLPLQRLYRQSTTASTQTDNEAASAGTQTGADDEQGRQLRCPYFGFGEIDLEAEKQKNYVKAAKYTYDDLTDIELLNAMKYLQLKRVNKVDGTKLMQAIQYVRSTGLREVTNTILVRQNTRQAEKDRLIQILVQSGFDDAEDVVGRYEKRFDGDLPTEEEFVEFYENLRGIVDLEKKLAKANVNANENDRLAQVEKRRADEKDRLAQAEKRRADEKDRLAQAEKRRADEKDRLVEEEKTKVKELEIKAQRSMCKVCMTEEVSVLFLPCGHLYSCESCATAPSYDGIRRCAMCRSVVDSQLLIKFS